MPDQDDNAGQVIGTIANGWRNSKTGQVTQGAPQPLTGHPISKEQFGLAPGPGGDNTNFPDH